MCRFRMMPKSKTTATLIELGLIYLSLQLALPAALAVYPPVIYLRPFYPTNYLILLYTSILCLT